MSGKRIGPRKRTTVPRDQGWFKIATIVTYFFPGSGGSGISSVSDATAGGKGEGGWDTLGREKYVGMLTSSKLAVPAASLSSCRAYCSAMPGFQVSAGVARIRVTCEAVSAAPSGERRVREPVPKPRKERRKSPLCSALL
jgi:hypothetical protein